MKKVFPKVLIIGQYFSKKPGGTITLTHLFHGWDKNNIAVAAENIQDPDFEICDKFYQLGSLERKNNFPFNVKLRKQEKYSGKLKETNNSDSPEKLIPKSKQKSSYDRLLSVSGLSHFKSRFVISEQFENWIKDFSPDYIYSQLSSLDLILLLNDLYEKTKIPIAIHMMDDWPITIGKESAFYSYWNKRINRNFQELLAKSSVFMSISEAMSKEYLSRYGKHFTPFHNPVNLDFWGKDSKRNYDLNNPIIILYAGRIGKGIRKCFFDIACAIQNLIQKGYHIELQMQITNHDDIIQDLKKFDFIKFNKMVPFEKLPQQLSGSDVLLLPNDFEKEAMPFLKFSMPTKASEYMISGTPILLYASKEAAITIHALKYGWAHVVSEKDPQHLEKGIIEIISRKELRIKLGDTAKTFAQFNYDGNIIRDQFRETFTLNEFDKVKTLGMEASCIQMS